MYIFKIVYLIKKINEWSHVGYERSFKNRFYTLCYITNDTCSTHHAMQCYPNSLITFIFVRNFLIKLFDIHNIVSKHKENLSVNHIWSYGKTSSYIILVLRGPYSQIKKSLLFVRLWWKFTHICKIENKMG